MSEIRMYVELLFEGRTMTRETIDLKEEIYGNLMARYEDLLAQGLSEAEALERTKASITSVDDVLEGEGAGAAEGGVPGADATMAGVTVPLPGGSGAGAADADATVAAAAGTGTPAAARRRPSTGMVVAIVGGVFLVLVAVVVALGAAGGRAYETVGSGTTVSDQGGTGDSGSATDSGGTTGTTTTTTGGTSGDATTTDGKTTGGTTGSTTTGGTVPSDALYAEVAEGSVDLIAPYAGTSLSDTARVEELVRALPLGAYVTEVATDAARGTATITYTYEDRDYVARDDDYVDLALVYDTTALMSAMGDLDSVTVIEVETKDYDYDRDVAVFERTVMEALLGTSLSPDQLTVDAWDTVCAQVTTRRVWDEIWERSERG